VGGEIVQRLRDAQRILAGRGLAQRERPLEEGRGLLRVIAPREREREPVRRRRDLAGSGARMRS